MNKTQWLVIALVAALLFNAFVHWTNPAYRYYVDNVDLFRKDYKTFVDQVRLEFVPAIMSVATNQPATVVYTNQINGVVLKDTVKSDNVDEIIKEEKDLPVFFWRMNNTVGVEYNGFRFLPGDNFFGSEIVYIDPTLLQTKTHTFRIKQR